MTKLTIDAKNFLNSIDINNLHFIYHDNVDSCCNIDCGRYIHLFQNSLSLRCSPQKISLSFSESGLNANAEFYDATDYALIDLNESDAAYRKKIGDATQSLVNRSIGAGFYCSEFNAREFDDDIRAILTSTDKRSDRSVPQEWFNPDYKLPVWVNGLCDRHKELSFGVFSSKRKLVALCTVRFFGECASFNFIIGHSDFLSSGVMHFMVYSLRNYLIKNRPEVNFLHYMWMGKPSYANYYHFKSGTGFRGGSICLVDNPLFLNGIKKEVINLVNYILPEKNNNNIKSPNVDVKPSKKLFKFKATWDPENLISISEEYDLINLALINSNKDDVIKITGREIFTDLAKQFLSENKSIDVNFIKDRFLFKIKINNLEINSCFSFISDSYEGRTKRGDVLGVIIESDGASNDNLIKLFNQFKGSQFQTLIFFPGIKFEKLFIFILLIKI